MLLNNLVMTLGPVQIDPEILAIANMQIPYPRTPEYSNWFEEIDTNLQYLFQTKRHVFSVACSGTGAMQMAVDNLCTLNDSVLTFSTGVFGKRWGQIARSAGADVIEVPVEEGKNVTPDLLLECINKYKKVKIIFLTHNETSTTALADIKNCAKILNDTEKILVVDAVSSLLAEPMKMDEWGIDVVLSCSQKALALPPGLGFIAFSEKAWKIVEKKQCKSLYFDAKAYEHEWYRHQAPYTVPLSIILQLKKRLSNIHEEGLDHFQERYKCLTSKLRKGLLNLSFSFPTRIMGNCTTAACVPKDIDAAKFTFKLRSEKGIAIGAPYPDRQIVRIGNYGSIGEKEIDFALLKINEVINEMRINTKN